MKKTFLIFIVFITLNSFSQSYPDSEKDGKYYTINGAKIWVVSFGKGDPIFILSSGLADPHYELRSFDALSATNALVFYDGFGRGKSSLAKNVTEYSIQHDIDDLDALRKAMGYTSISILGHSYGGIVAQGYAIQHPQFTKHLILANTFHSFLMWQEKDNIANREIKTHYPELWFEINKAREEGFRSIDSIHQSVYRKVPYGFLNAYNPDTFIRKESKTYPNPFNAKLYYHMVGRDGDVVVENEMNTFDYRIKLKVLKMPILIISGRYDRIAVPDLMVKYKEYCPQAKFVMFEKSGHHPQIEQSEETFEVIREFLK